MTISLPPTVEAATSAPTAERPVPHFAGAPVRQDAILPRQSQLKKGA